MADEDISQPSQVSLEPEQTELDLGQPAKPPAQPPADKAADYLGFQPPPSPKAKADGVEVLRAQLAEMQNRAELERKAREETERVARQREQELSQYRQQAVEAQNTIADSQYQTIVNTIDAFRRDSELAKRDYAQGHAAQNWEAVAEAQARMARAEAQIVQLENGKVQLEEQAKQWKQQQEYQATHQPAQRQYTPQERFDAYVGQFSPRAQAYLRQHPEFATDDKLNRRLLRVHGEAVDEHGIVPDSEDYYRFLDDRMAVAQQPQSPRASSPPARQQFAPAAPVSRAPVNGASHANSVTLSPAEREAARIAGISEVEYAKQMLALEATGDIVRH